MFQNKVEDQKSNHSAQKAEKPRHLILRIFHDHPPHFGWRKIRVDTACPAPFPSSLPGGHRYTAGGAKPGPPQLRTKPAALFDPSSAGRALFRTRERQFLLTLKQSVSVSSGTRMGQRLLHSMAVSRSVLLPDLLSRWRSARGTPPPRSRGCAPCWRAASSSRTSRR